MEKDLDGEDLDGERRKRQNPTHAKVHYIRSNEEHCDTEAEWEDELRVAGGQQDSIKPPKD